MALFVKRRKREQDWGYKMKCHHKRLDSERKQDDKIEVALWREAATEIDVILMGQPEAEPEPGQATVYSNET